MKLQYYIPYYEKTNINYLLLLCLYDIAEFNPNTHLYDKITYQSMAKLSEKINIEFAESGLPTKSIRTIERMLVDKRYEPYFVLNKSTKEIILKNNIKDSSKFVVLRAGEVLLLRKYGEALFIKYYLHLKYQCLRSKSKKIDSTLEQMLAAMGYSYRSNANVSKLSYYNRLLVEEGFIIITKYRDNNGFERNAYQFR